MAEIGRMTWRRFQVLLRGLSGDSVTASVARSRPKAEPVISKPGEVDAALRRVFGGGR